MKYIPNILTIFRILTSLLIVMVSDKYFFPLYFFAGVTDILDGWIARKMNWMSRFGTLLDSFGDLLFLLWGTLVIVLIRCITYLIGYFRFHLFASLHVYLNKLTGLLLFLYPIVLLIIPITPFGIILLVCGSLSAIEELLIVTTTERLDQNVPTILNKKKLSHCMMFLYSVH